MVVRTLKRLNPRKLMRWPLTGRGWSRPAWWKPSLRALTWWDAGALVALVAWLTLQVLLQQSVGSLTQTDPIIHYYPAAQALLEGEGIEAFRADVFRGPLYPVQVAAVARLAGVGLFTASKFISAGTTVLFAAFSYLLLRRVFNPATGLIATLLIMAVNTFSWNSTVPSTDIPFAWLAVASLYFMVRGEHGPRWFDLLIAGMLAGLAFVTRWTGQIAPVFLAAWFVLLPPRLVSWRQRVGLAALFLLGFVLVSAPWLYANMQLHGSPMYNEAAIAVDPDLMPVRTSMGEAIRGGIEEQGLFPFGLRLATKFFTSFPPAIQGLNTYPNPVGWVMAGPFWVVIALGFVPLLIDLDWRKLFLVATTVLQWGALVFFHYESRFFIPSLPLFAALPVYIFTSDLLPDLKLRLRWKPGFKFTAGRGLSPRPKGQRRPAQAAGQPVGLGLTALVLIVALSLAVADTAAATRAAQTDLTETQTFYADLLAFLEDEAGGRQLRPVAARQWSPARYWIPWETGTPVLPLPVNAPYTSVLPEVSFLLVDQYGFEDALEPYWDHDSLADLVDPLAAPPALELAYYMAAPRHVRLYRVLADNILAEITGAEIAGANEATPLSRLWDSDPALVWRSEPVEAGDDVTLTFTLDRALPLNRVWLLPDADPATWPASLRVEVGQDADTLAPVAEVALDPLDHNRAPVALTLPETEGDTVRLVLTARPPTDSAAEDAMLGLAEVRFSQASERAVTALPLAIEGRVNSRGILETASGIAIDPLNHELVARVENRGVQTSGTTVNFYTGWSQAGLTFIGAGATGDILPGATGVARLSLWDWEDALAPGECQPVWVTFDVQGGAGVSLDTYGVEFEPSPWAMNSQVCNPQFVVLEGYRPGGELSTAGWAQQTPEEPALGAIRADFDEALGASVLSITPEKEESLVVTHLAQVYDHTHFSATINATENFLILVRIRDGEDYYYLQYMRGEWESYPEAYPEGRYLYYVLEPFYASGDWFTLERDLQADYRAVTGRDFEMIEAVSVRAYGAMKLANMRLSTSRLSSGRLESGR